MADEAACRLFGLWARQLVSMGTAVLFSGLRRGEHWQEMILEAVGPVDGEAPLYFFPTLDLALEWCEDRILAEQAPAQRRHDEMPLAEHPALSTLTAEELEQLRRCTRKVVAPPGEAIVRQGDAADSMYFLTSGNVTVNLRLHDGRRHRIATMGAGAMFGELAMIERELRTADVDAETTVICHALTVADLERVEEAAPGIRLKLLSGVARDLAGRLRRADREIAALVS
jgi:glutaminase